MVSARSARAAQSPPFISREVPRPSIPLLRIHHLWGFVLLVTLCGCGSTWSPETLIEDLRVIGVRADPAEIKPGESAAITALVFDPSRPGKATTVFWVGCDPDPFNLGRSACSDPVALQDPTALIGAATLPPGVKFIGLNEHATYAVDKNLFQVLAADDPRRQTGTVGQILAISIGAETTGVPTNDELAALFARVKSKEVQAVITLFRVRVSESPSRNQNPVISTFSVAGELQFPGAHVQLGAAEARTVAIDATEDSFESFILDTPTGPKPTVEHLTSAWYSTSGRFNYERIALRGAVPGIFTAPGSPDNPTDVVPLRRNGTLYAVLRDSRGGQTWADYPFFICDTFLEGPILTAVHSPATRADPVVIEGRSLENVLDVIVGGVALENGAFNALTGSWEALVPNSLLGGSYPVRLHGKECRRGETAFTLTIPN